VDVDAGGVVTAGFPVALLPFLIMGLSLVMAGWCWPNSDPRPRIDSANDSAAQGGHDPRFVARRTQGQLRDKQPSCCVGCLACAPGRDQEA
jgi:hypothetical protein